MNDPTPIFSADVQETLDRVRSSGQLPMPSGLSQDALPHEWLRLVAMTDGLELDDTQEIFNGSVRKHRRIFTITERLGAAKAAAEYYAPKQKSVEATVKDANQDTVDKLSGLSRDELIAMLEKQLNTLKGLQ